jgi:hypothetical protein
VRIRVPPALDVDVDADAYGKMDGEPLRLDFLVRALGLVGIRMAVDGEFTGGEDE